MKSTVEMLLPKIRFLLFVNRNTVLFFDGEVYHSVRESICIRHCIRRGATANFKNIYQVSTPKKSLKM
jgi:hypothetical protein